MTSQYRWKWDTISRVGSEHLGMLINEYRQYHHDTKFREASPADVYDLPSPVGMTHEEIDNFLHKALQSPRRVRWDQLQGFELIVINLLTKPRMEWVASLFEIRLQEITADQSPDVIRNSGGRAEMSEESLREYLRCLSVRYFHRRAALADQELLRVYMLLYASLLTIIICALAGILYFRYAYFGDTANPYRIPVFQISICMGAVGSFVSLQRRIQGIPTTTVRPGGLTQLRIGQLPVFLVPVLGAVFAGLVFFLVSSGMLTGGLFPTMQSGSGGAITSVQYTYTAVDQTVPATVADFYKLLVWCFIAGFAEKLVPNVLDRLAGEAADARRSAEPKR
jgi:hypothetical protein